MRDPVYRRFPGYAEAIAKVRAQSLEDDLKLVDALLGREHLQYGDDAAAVKCEALRQLEIEYRDCVDDLATFYVGFAHAMRQGDRS